MENIWAVLKANISNYKPSSTKELIRIIKKEWEELDKVQSILKLSGTVKIIFKKFNLNFLGHVT